ncbi:MAG: hypothetical protein E7588_04850 [Ruminococcaceae bacterium]|nr:hypothetical protein [Oscillospiraceae bacterium]
MIKKICALVLLLTLFVTVVAARKEGYAVAFDNSVFNYPEFVPDAKLMSAETSVYEHYYNQLSDEAKVYYDIIKDASPVSENVSIKLPDITQNSEEQALAEFDRVVQAYCDAVNAFEYDHAEIFAQSYAIGESLQTNGSQVTIKSSIGIRVKQRYSDDAIGAYNAVQSASKAFNAVSDDTIGVLLEIHKYICDNAEYVLEGVYAHEPYGMLVKGETVCEGYAEAFKILCDKYSIPCVIVTGDADNGSGSSEPHMWNSVNIDGIWYAVDCTWDDSDDGTVYYKFLLAGNNSLGYRSDKFSDSHVCRDTNDVMIFDEKTYYSVLNYPVISDEKYIVKISDAAELQNYVCDYYMFNAQLSNNIDCTALDSFKPIEDFTETFDGNGYTLAGLNIDSERQYCGFVETNNGIIKSLGLYDVNFSLNSSSVTSLGGICGLNFGTVSDCYVTGALAAACTATNQNAVVGGIAGLNSGRISDCYFDGSVSTVDPNAAVGLVGGIVGRNTTATVSHGSDGQQTIYGKVSCCYASPDISVYPDGYAVSDGICGYMDNATEQEYCYADGYTNSPIELTDLSKFTGFSPDKWHIDVQGGYEYPQLKAVEHFYVSSLEITSMPDKTVYRLGADFSPDGMETVAYVGRDNKQMKIHPIIQGFDSTQKCKCTVSASYYGKSDTFDVHVRLDVKGGDVNADGAVNISDVILFLQYLAARDSIILSQEQKESADTHFDGALNTSDAIRLCQHLANKNNVVIDW